MVGFLSQKTGGEMRVIAGDVSLPKHVAVFYYVSTLALELPQEADNQVRIGTVLLTKIGKELAAICGSEAVSSFREYVNDQWKEYLPRTDAKPESGADKVE